MTDANWLPDPSGRHELRYWNGNAWSDHVSDGGVASTDTPGRLGAPVSAAKGLAAKVASQAREMVSGGGGPAVGGDAIVTAISKDEGRNARVTLYRDRIERVKEKPMMSLSRAHQDTEVIPIRSVSSVQAKKVGLRTNVTVFATGNTIEFRLGHDEAQRFKDAVMQLLLAPSAPPSPPAPAPASATVSVADELKKLAELRDTGVLSAAEFEAQKAKLLS